MKRHVIRQHICNDEWWFLYPLLSCWVCRKWEIARHCRLHGPFRATTHLPGLVQLVERFTDFIRRTLRLKSTDDLVQFTSTQNLCDDNSAFSPEEIEVWDAYDNFIGLPKLRNRSVASPSRLSSVFHWRTLQRLLILATASADPAVAMQPWFIDSHCHIDRLLRQARFNGTLSMFLNSHPQETTVNSDGFMGCIAVFCDTKTLINKDTWSTLVDDPLVYAATVGLHPKEVHNFSPDTLELVRRSLEHPKVCALGEVGLDYSGTFRESKGLQKYVLRQLLQIAVGGGLPLVIHCRDAEEDCFRILSEDVPRHWKIHLHCFSRGLLEAQKWCSAFPNLYIGFTPMLSRNRNAQEAVLHLPLERLLLETDSPYFVPRQPQGACHYSNPTIARQVGQEVARLRGLPEKDVLKQCLENTKKMYCVKL